MTSCENNSYPIIQHVQDSFPEQSLPASRRYYNGDADILSVRDLIKYDQDRRLSLPGTLKNKDQKRKIKEDLLRNNNVNKSSMSEEKFKLSMEQKMMKWKPTVSNNCSINGSVMYIEGTHPYQFDTPLVELETLNRKSLSESSKNNTKMQKDKKKRGFSISGATDITDTTFTNTTILANSNSETRTKMNNNIFESHEYRTNHINDLETPYGLVYSENKKDKKIDKSIDMTELKNIYQNTYGIKLPEDYLESLNYYHRNQNNMHTNTKQNNVKKKKEENNWFTSCFSKTFPNCL
ncbi:hypothetical protein TPHA_0A03190 [Tetrapisispora phaffii CBS 4417]|uniref:Uncharacterized protein n=1 Tax=Tetrapisispora phaffii (strain ATCC 24235 / CBS 4417 / NBRC 1672 / NRRL Y-8282 / UCD 70-5) TaxID=1071381 RepID=G8BNB7_TETPH|nr:hypothetical protein TPHA_0A03190 [Tetrapisispora phaffii CBS 4417]CCE61395.1 hypothetical protein TPHA_0A03190 [Tetrapisispora phaffii CBS 4417]